MISKKDVLDYFNQVESKVLKLEKFYGEIFSETKDIEYKEMFLRLQGEEKGQLELIRKLKETFEKKWQS